MFKILRTLNKTIGNIVAAGIMMTVSTAVQADIAIIAHPDYQGGELDEELVKQLFLNETTSYPSGHKATPANHAVGSPDRKAFFEYVLKMGESRHKRYWSRKVSSGKKTPVELGSHSAVLDWISDNPLGITYIDEDKVDDSVKVLFTIAVFDDL